jgi:hypothetical protein
MRRSRTWQPNGHALAEDMQTGDMSATQHPEPSANLELINASWRALIDPRPWRPAPGTSARQLLELVDDAWADDRQAWSLATCLLRYASEHKTTEVTGLPAGAATIAYATAVAVYDELRRSRVLARLA